MRPDIRVIVWQIALEEERFVHIRLDRRIGIGAARHREIADVVAIAPQLQLAVQGLGVEARRFGERGIAQRLGNAVPLNEIEPDIFQRVAQLYAQSFARARLSGKVRRQVQDRNFRIVITRRCKDSEAHEALHKSESGGGRTISNNLIRSNFAVNAAALCLVYVRAVKLSTARSGNNRRSISRGVGTAIASGNHPPAGRCVERALRIQRSGVSLGAGRAAPFGAVGVGCRFREPTLVAAFVNASEAPEGSFRRRDQAAISLNSMVSGVWWTGPPRLGSSMNSYPRRAARARSAAWIAAML